jgi:hypothetical protein
MNRPVRGRAVLARGPFVMVVALLSTSCGARLMKLPAGPGAPASDMTQVLTEATASCRDVTALTAEVGVSGSVHGRRLRARLLVGLERPASARVEAFAFGQQILILVSRADQATLLLTRDNRVLRGGRPSEILEAVAGVPLDAANLRTTLLGCDAAAMSEAAGSTPGAAPAAVEGRQIGEDWRVATGGSSELYFQRQVPDRRWRLVAALHRQSTSGFWRAEYRDFENNLPRTLRLVDNESRRFDLRLALSQVELNATLPAAAFDVNIPSTADPVTLEELREAGPIPGE